MIPLLQSARCSGVALFFLTASLATSGLRAQTPGEVDPAFAVGPDADGSVFALALQSDGAVLAGGSFTTFRGAARSALARLTPDGTLDAFNPGLVISPIGAGAPEVDAVAVQSDGKIIVGGQFTALGSGVDGGVVRLNADGSQDTAFNAGSGVANNGGAYGKAYALAALADGRMIVGGAFVDFAGQRGACLARLTGNGAPDPTFNPAGAGFANGSSVAAVRTVVVLGDGRLLVGGSFTTYDGTPAPGIVRLSADGAYDGSFALGSGADGEVRAIAVQSDGRVLAAGAFNHFNGATVSHIVRLNADGSLDATYNPHGGGVFNGGLNAIALQPDGAALVGGNLRADSGLVTGPRFGVARFLADGTVDTSFDPGSAAREVTALALQPDGKVLAAGNASGSLVGGAPGDVFRLYAVNSTPLADLSGTFTNGKITLIANGAKVKVKGTLTLSNTGAKKAKRFNVTAYLAPSATFDSSVDTYLGSFEFVGSGNGKLKAGASYTLPFKAKGPSDQFSPSEYLLLLIDSGEKIPESNEANNLIAIGPLPAP